MTVDDVHAFDHGVADGQGGALDQIVDDGAGDSLGHVHRTGHGRIGFGVDRGDLEDVFAVAGHVVQRQRQRVDTRRVRDAVHGGGDAVDVVGAGAHIRAGDGDHFVVDLDRQLGRVAQREAELALFGLGFAGQVVDDVHVFVDEDRLWHEQVEDAQHLRPGDLPTEVDVAGHGVAVAGVLDAFGQRHRARFGIDTVQAAQVLVRVEAALLEVVGGLVDVENAVVEAVVVGVDDVAGVDLPADDTEDVAQIHHRQPLAGDFGVGQLGQRIDTDFEGRSRQVDAGDHPWVERIGVVAAQRRGPIQIGVVAQVEDVELALAAGGHHCQVEEFVPSRAVGAVDAVVAVVVVLVFGRADVAVAVDVEGEVAAHGVAEGARQVDVAAGDHLGVVDAQARADLAGRFLGGGDGVFDDAQVVEAAAGEAVDGPAVWGRVELAVVGHVDLHRLDHVHDDDAQRDDVDVGDGLILARGHAVGVGQQGAAVDHLHRAGQAGVRRHTDARRIADARGQELHAHQRPFVGVLDGTIKERIIHAVDDGAVGDVVVAAQTGRHVVDFQLRFKEVEQTAHHHEQVTLEALVHALGVLVVEGNVGQDRHIARRLHKGLAPADQLGRGGVGRVHHQKFLGIGRVGIFLILGTDAVGHEEDVAEGGDVLCAGGAACGIVFARTQLHLVGDGRVAQFAQGSGRGPAEGDGIAHHHVVAGEVFDPLDEDGILFAQLEGHIGAEDGHPVLEEHVHGAADGRVAAVHHLQELFGAVHRHGFREAHVDFLGGVVEHGGQDRLHHGGAHLVGGDHLRRRQDRVASCRRGLAQRLDHAAGVGADHLDRERLVAVTGHRHPSVARRGVDERDAEGRNVQIQPQAVGHRDEADAVVFHHVVVELGEGRSLQDAVAPGGDHAHFLTGDDAALDHVIAAHHREGVQLVVLAGGDDLRRLQEGVARFGNRAGEGRRGSAVAVGGGVVGGAVDERPRYRAVGQRDGAHYQHLIVFRSTRGRGDGQVDVAVRLRAVQVQLHAAHKIDEEAAVGERVGVGHRGAVGDGQRQVGGVGDGFHLDDGAVGQRTGVDLGEDAAVAVHDAAFDADDDAAVFAAEGGHRQAGDIARAVGEDDFELVGQVRGHQRREATQRGVGRDGGEGVACLVVDLHQPLRVHRPLAAGDTGKAVGVGDGRRNHAGKLRRGAVHTGERQHVGIGQRVAAEVGDGVDHGQRVGRLRLERRRREEAEHAAIGRERHRAVDRARGRDQTEAGAAHGGGVDRLREDHADGAGEWHTDRAVDGRGRNDARRCGQQR